jgi:hypothetical protein
VLRLLGDVLLLCLFDDVGVDWHIGRLSLGFL